MVPNKLPKIPPKLFNTNCHITIPSGELNRYGEPVECESIKCKCIFSEKSKSIMSAEKQLVQLEGTVIIDNTVEFDNKVSDGEISINDKTYKIYRCIKAKNPNGTIHHTTLELM